MRVVTFIIKLFAIVIASTFCTHNLYADDDPIQIDSIGQLQETCDLSNGQLTIHVPTISINYEYSIDGGLSWQSSHVFTNLESGDYLVVVRDGLSCSKTVTAQVADAPQPTVQVSAECIPGLNRVRIAPMANGGIQPLRFNWEGPNGFTDNKDFLLEVIPGRYSVTVTDALGCTYSDSLTIDECCSMTLACDLQDSTLYCVDDIPDSPFEGGTGAYSKEETIQILASLGITVNVGSCGDLTVVTNETINYPSDCRQDTLSIIREYSISDSHTTFNCSQEFTLVDHMKVILDSPAVPADGLCGNTLESEFQNWLAAMGGMQFTACSDPITTSTLPANPTIDNFCGASTEVTFLVEDGCGNITSSLASFSVKDSEVPELTCPVDLTINPSDPNLETLLLDWEDTAYTADNCGAATVTNDLDSSRISTDCSSQPMIPVTYVARDACGLESSCTAIINIVAPNSSLLICGEDLIINCDEDKTTLVDTWLSDFYAEDNNGNHDSPSNNLDLSMVLDLECNNTLEIEFSYQDECFRMQSCSKNIRVVDTTKPYISCPPDLELSTDLADPTLEVDLWLLSASVSDNCTTDPGIKTDFDADLSDLCSWGGDLSVQFTTEDLCGNVSVCSSNIKVILHTPVLICPEHLIVACGSSDPIDDLTDWSETAHATGHDDNPIGFLLASDLQAIACSESVDVVFSVRKSCNNVSFRYIRRLIFGRFTAAN